MEYEASICHSCGTNPSDWIDEDGLPREPMPYKAKGTKCYGCVALEEARANIGSDKHDRTVTYRLTKVPKAQGLKDLEEWQMKTSKSN